MSRDWLLYLDDLVESADKVTRFVAGLDFESFKSNEVVFDAVLFNLEVVGTAAKKLPPEARAHFVERDLAGPAKLRDVIAHHYFAVDAAIIWEVATDYLPRLLTQARALRDAIENPGNRTSS